MRWLLLLCAVSLAGCSSVVLRKAELQSIRSAAVVAWFAAQRIPEVHGEGVFRKADDELRMLIAEDGLNAFTSAVEKLGWELAAPEELASKPAYKSAFRLTAFLPPPGQSSSAFRTHYFMASDLFPIWLGPDSSSPKTPGRRVVRSEKETLADLLRELRLDAALLFRTQYCFRTFERDGKEYARATAASAVQIIDRKGSLVYASEEPEGCGGKERGESQGAMALEGADWMFDPMNRAEFRKLFQQASEDEAARLVASLPVTPGPKERR